MTPFWNQTSPSNLYAATRGILACVQGTIEDGDELHWKIGLDARLEIYKSGIAIGKITKEMKKSRDKLKLGDHDLMFCGLRGVVYGREFPRNRIDLISAQRGHVGTIEIVQ